MNLKKNKKYIPTDIHGVLYIYLMYTCNYDNNKLSNNVKKDIFEIVIQFNLLGILVASCFM